VCRPKHVKQLRNIGIINSTTRLHLVGSFYEFCIMMHGSMNIQCIHYPRRKDYNSKEFILDYLANKVNLILRFT
jgi:calcineurin-like phosphoesterase family protein